MLEFLLQRSFGMLFKHDNLFLIVAAAPARPTSHADRPCAYSRHRFLLLLLSFHAAAARARGARAAGGGGRQVARGRIGTANRRSARRARARSCGAARAASAGGGGARGEDISALSAPRSGHAAVDDPALATSRHAAMTSPGGLARPAPAERFTDDRYSGRAENARQFLALAQTLRRRRWPASADQKTAAAGPATSSMADTTLRVLHAALALLPRASIALIRLFFISVSSMPVCRFRGRLPERKSFQYLVLRFPSSIASRGFEDAL